MNATVLRTTRDSQHVILNYLVKKNEMETTNTASIKQAYNALFATFGFNNIN
jgi:hypothetical protein